MERMVFVYRCNDCSDWWAVYAGDPLRCPACGSMERTHASTVDPAVIIARMLNGEDVSPELRGGCGPMKQTLVLKTPEVVERACHILRGLGFVEPHEVVIRPHKKDRSVAQNSLMWSWLTIIGAELGDTKDQVHEDMKGRFLVPIFEREDAGYAEMVMSLRKVYSSGMKDEAMGLMKRIIQLTSTTKANVAQMTEYLNDIEKWAAGMGIRLPHPEDI